MQVTIEVRKNKRSELLKNDLKYSLYICEHGDLLVTCYKHIIDISEYLQLTNIDFLYKYDLNLVNGNLHFKSLKKANSAKRHIESIMLVNKLYEKDSFF